MREEQQRPQAGKGRGGASATEEQKQSKHNTDRVGSQSHRKGRLQHYYGSGPPDAIEREGGNGELPENWLDWPEHLQQQVKVKANDRRYDSLYRNEALGEAAYAVRHMFEKPRQQIDHDMSHQGTPALPATNMRADDNEVEQEPENEGHDDEGNNRESDLAGDFFYSPFMRKRRDLPKIIYSRFDHISEGSNGVLRTINYTSMLLMLIEAVFGTTRRKDTLLHAAILMARLEIWFFAMSKYEKKDDFYKFIEPVQTTSRFHGRNYKPGDSWCEELGFTKSMFNSAFGLIGITYRSLGHYRTAKDEGREFIDNVGIERLYCAAHDNQKGYTWFYRNHQFANEVFTPPEKPFKKGGKGGE